MKCFLELMLLIFLYQQDRISANDKFSLDSSYATISENKQLYDLKETNRTERDLLICNSGSDVKVVNVEINSDSSHYSRLCDLERHLVNFQIKINVTLTTKKRPIASILNILHFHEKRVNGSSKVNAIGYVDSGAEPLLGLSFYVVYDVPNLNPAACYSVEGLIQQTGVGELTFSEIDYRRLKTLHEKYDQNQLVAIFRNQSVANCIGCTILSYTPGLMNEETLEELYPVSDIERRETVETVEQSLDVCETLSANVIRIEEQSKYKTWDSCDAIDLFDRYEGDVSHLSFYFGSSPTPKPIEINILYSNGFRNKSSFYGLAIGIVVKGPTSMIGAAYLESQDIPNFNPYNCQTEPGIKQMFGTVEKIVATMDIQNLLSVMDLNSIITKVRSNRIANCLGSVAVQYSPGLVSSKVLADQYLNLKDMPNNKKTNDFWKSLKNELQRDRIRKLFSTRDGLKSFGQKFINDI